MTKTRLVGFEFAGIFDKNIWKVWLLQCTVEAVSALKGQCHEIFDLGFFIK
jgi:hypothetical protein